MSKQLFTLFERKTLKSKINSLNQVKSQFSKGTSCRAILRSCLPLPHPKSNGHLSSSFIHLDWKCFLFPNCTQLWDFFAPEELQNLQQSSRRCLKKTQTKTHTNKKNHTHTTTTPPHTKNPSPRKQQKRSEPTTLRKTCNAQQ